MANLVRLVVVLLLVLLLVLHIRVASTQKHLNIRHHVRLPGELRRLGGIICAPGYVKEATSGGWLEGNSSTRWWGVRSMEVEERTHTRR